jgi:hypothetical protein
LAELFAGNEPLFRGLYCHDKWDWEIKYLVIRISFGGGLMKSPDTLEASIRFQLKNNAKRLGVTLEDDCSARSISFPASTCACPGISPFRVQSSAGNCACLQ